MPQLLTTDTIDLEGNELRVIRIGRADTAESTVLYVPSLGIPRDQPSRGRTARGLSSKSLTLRLREDLVGGLGPDEGVGPVVIPVVDEGADLGVEFLDGAERAPADGRVIKRSYSVPTH